MRALWRHACEELGARPRHVVHVGAHWAQEAADYEAYLPDAGPPTVDDPSSWPGNPRRTVDWFEADPSTADRARAEVGGALVLRSNAVRHRVHTALLAEKSGITRPFWIADNDGCSSSMLPFYKHTDYAPTRMAGSIALTTTTLDDYYRGISRIVDDEWVGPDWLTLDVQGAEVKVIEGAGVTLGGVEWIVAEVSTVPLYSYGALIDDVDRVLANEFAAKYLDAPYNWRFERVVTDLSMFDGTHGDALYRRIRP